MKLAPLAAGAVTLLALSGCQAAGESTEEAFEPIVAEDSLIDGCAQTGDAVEALTISDDVSASPTVEFEGPLDVGRTQKLTVVSGGGETVEELDRVQVAYAYFNGATGAEIGHIGYDGESPDVIPADTSFPYLTGVVYTLLCSQVGDRVAAVIPAEEAFGAEGAPEYGLEAGSPVIFVADILGIQPPPEPPLEKLGGEQAEPPAGFPTVEWAATGQPIVVIPEGDVPTDYAVATVIKGDGAMVYDGANIIVHYHGVNWNTGEVFDSSWDRGEPASFPTSGVIPGFRDGLVGQTVGSRVFITIPPALGYGPSGGTGDGRIGAEDTIFFVVDILGLQ
ncbi:MAG: FKBP-type peptidyl-prolyl cis-trans isomerase [Pontimonas sp.]